MRKLAIVLLLLASTCHAATRYVSTTGNDGNACSTTDSAGTNKATLSGGISCMAAGDTLYIHAGTYTATYSYSGPNGTSYTDAPIISAYSGETVTLASTGGQNAPLTINNHSYVQFQNLIFDGIAQTGPSDASGGVMLIQNGSHHIRFTNCEFKRAYSNNVLTAAGGGSDPHHLEFISCTFHDSRNVGYSVHGCYASRTSDSIWDKCVFYNNPYYGLHIYEGIANVCNRNVVKNCTFHDNGKKGGTGVVAGLLLSSGNDNIAYNCIFYSEPSLATQTFLGTNNQFYNLTVYNVGKGTSDAALQLTSSSTNAKVQNLILWNNYSNTIQNLGTGTTLSNNLTVDPSFVNAASQDFHLQSGSAAKDAGISLSSIFTTDFDAVGRPQGASWDEGAYEYVVASPNSLSLTFPNGGERWLIGESRTILWAYSGTLTNVDLAVSTDGGANYGAPFASNISVGSNGQGSYSWTVTGPVGSNCRIQVKDHSSATNDVSDADFRIGGIRAFLAAE